MLPKKNRLDLRNTEGFFENCQKIHLQEFSIYLKENQVKETQATVIVSKKTEKLATNRSRIKRIYRAALQSFVSDTQLQKQIVIIVHKSGKKLTVEQITTKLKTHVA